MGNKFLGKMSKIGANLVITTPIFYINARPHLGHLYTLVLADYNKRFFTAQKVYQNVFLLTGTDEHGKKVSDRALAEKLEIRDFCNKSSLLFENLARDFDINYDYFHRTTFAHHKDFVTQVWLDLEGKDLIYPDQYTGYYSLRDESFIPEKDLLLVTHPSGQISYTTTEGSPVEHTSERNYLFRLSNFSQKISDFFGGNPNVISPEQKSKITRGELLSSPIGDLSVSRDSKRVAHGIPVPGDAGQTIYVWFDALLNYLSGTKFLLGINSGLGKSGSGTGSGSDLASSFREIEF